MDSSWYSLCAFVATIENHSTLGIVVIAATDGKSLLQTNSMDDGLLSFAIVATIATTHIFATVVVAVETITA